MLKIKNGYGYFIATLFKGIDMPARTSLVKNKVLKTIGEIEKTQLELQKSILKENNAFSDTSGRVQYKRNATEEDKKAVADGLTKIANDETELPLSENEVTLLKEFFSKWDGIVPSELSYAYEYLIDTLGL